MIVREGYCEGTGWSEHKPRRSGPPLSATLRSLVLETQGRGFTVTHAGNCVTIYKARGKTITLGVMIFTSDTGTFFQAIRADTRLDACTAIRTIKGVRKALEL
jgi:hypothetical protein